jgi:hypothetical protein
LLNYGTLFLPINNIPAKTVFLTSTEAAKTHAWFHEYLHQSLLNHFLKNENYKQLLEQYTKQVELAKTLPPVAVQELLKQIIRD